MLLLGASVGMDPAAYSQIPLLFWFSGTNLYSLGNKGLGSSKGLGVFC